MIVYIEGVDGSGKSTFAKAITEYLKGNGLIVHEKAEKAMVTHPWRLDRIDKATLVRRIRERVNSDEIYIVDRGELSDIIYRTFDFEKYSALMTLDQFYTLWRAFNLRNDASYIIVHCDSIMSEELMNKRGEDNPVSIHEHQKLRYLFNQIMPLFNAIKFDAATSMEVPDYLNSICEQIRMTLVMNGARDDG